MRSAILVDSVLNFESRGELIHGIDADGTVHLAFTRNAFLASIARAKATAAIMQATPQRNVVGIESVRAKH